MFLDDVLLKHFHILDDGGWTDCQLKSLSAVFQSYQDDVRVMMKGCVQKKPIYIRTSIFRQREWNS